MSLNFPSAPALNQKYVSDGLTFIWNGVVWYVQNQLQWSTDAQGIAGVLDNVAMTPSALKATSDANPPGATTPVGTPKEVGRSFSINYQNTAGYPMLVAVVLSGNATEDSTCSVLIGANNPANDTVYSTFGVRRSGKSSLQFIVPKDWWYRLNPSRNPILTRVVEWS